MNDAVTIVAAAIKTPDGEVFTVPAPARHHHIIGKIREARGTYPTASEQGFLNSNGRFVRRAAAAMVAARAGQLKRGLTAPPRLYSEDLW